MSTELPRVEYKFIGFRPSEPIAGLPAPPTSFEAGTFSGLLATWDLDTSRDQFVKGAFARSIQEHRDRGNRPVRLRYMHENLIGFIPLETVYEDAAGLHVGGAVNLGTSVGRDVWALIQQGALSDLSIAFRSKRETFKEGNRLILEAEIVEGSVVDEPANRAAKIVSLKAHASAATWLADTPGEDLREPARRTATAPADEKTLMADLLSNLCAARDDLRAENESIERAARMRAIDQRLARKDAMSRSLDNARLFARIR